MSKLDNVFNAPVGDDALQHYLADPAKTMAIHKEQLKVDIKALVIDTMLEALEKTDSGYDAIAEFRKEVENW